MNPYEFPFDKSQRKELLGPRPTPLKVRKDSHKIKKPPLPPSQQQSEQQQPYRPPVIIYTVSPKIIHTNPNEFMTLVQRLTGSSSSYTNNNTNSYAAGDSVSPATCSINSYAAAGVVLPAARYATIEKAEKSPKGEINQESDGDHFQTKKGADEDEDDEYNNHGVVVERRSNLFPGILSPGPSSLQPIQPNFFFSPPPSDPNSIRSFFHDLSPVQHGNKTYIEGSFMNSPSNFFSSNMISPTQSIDLFNNFID